MIARLYAVAASNASSHLEYKKVTLQNFVCWSFWGLVAGAVGVHLADQAITKAVTAKRLSLSCSYLQLTLALCL